MRTKNSKIRSKNSKITLKNLANKAISKQPNSNIILCERQTKYLIDPNPDLYVVNREMRRVTK